MILPKKRDPRLITIRRGGSLTDAHHQLLALSEGRLDLGFCRLPAPKGWPVLPVVRAHFVAVLPAGYQGVTGLSDLLDKPLAILRRDKAPSFHDQFVHYLAQSGLRFGDIQYVNDFAAGIATAAAGIAWTLVPSSTTIEHPVVTRIVMGVSQEVPQLAWRLTKSFWLGGCVYNAEDLARGAA